MITGKLHPKVRFDFMKLFKCICLLMCSTLTFLNAQKLVNKENQWNVAIYPTFTPDFSSYSIRLFDDTLVNGLMYHKIYYSFDSLNTNWIYQNGLLREDGSNKVYYKQDNENERVLYDFGLKINDIFKINEFCTLQVEETDTITLNDGQARKRLKLVRKGDPNWGHEYWIDGVGSQYGLINHFRFCETDYSDVLLCFYKNSNLLFPKAPTSCFLTKNEDLKSGLNIKVYPNPFHTNIEFDLNNSIQTNYRIITLTGKPIQKGRLQNTISKINLESLPCGIYFLVFQSDNGKQSAIRLIKQ